MTNQTNSSKRADPYARITDRILAELEQGVRPWMKPWSAGTLAGRVTRPLRSTGEPYAGINVILLWMEAVANGYASPTWMTYKQAQAHGGQVRRGEQGAPIVYFGSTTKKSEQTANGSLELEGEGREIRFLKTYHVFNVAQIDGLPERFHPEPVEAPAPAFERIEAAERYFEATGARVALLTGRDKGKAREATLMGLLDGSIDLVVGTHAIFQDAVSYRNLAMVVIDEQHRFGVGQRLMLASKGRRAPHVLAMTATPIPRTLTLAQYGELDVSKLDELPPGRQAIDTVVMGQARIGALVDRLAAQIAEGRQAYWVCPMVREMDGPEEIAAAEARYAALKERFGDDVVMVHGQLGAELKDAAMERFARGDAKSDD